MGSQRVRHEHAANRRARIQARSAVLKAYVRGVVVSTQKLSIGIFFFFKKNYLFSNFYEK